jgi:hypothetical protein
MGYAGGVTMEPDSVQTSPDPPLFVLEYRKPDLIPERPLLAVVPRIFHFLTAVILPLVCFAMSVASYPPGPDYQRAYWSDYLGLIPTARVGWAFYPLLIFSIYAAAMMVIVPKKAIDWFHIRIGLFTGVILAYQYSFIQAACYADGSSRAEGTVIALSAPAVFVAGMVFGDWVVHLAIWNAKWYRGRGRFYFWIGLAVLGAASGAVFPRGLGNAIEITLIAPLFLAPGLTLTTFVLLSILVLRRGNRLNPPTWIVLPWTLGWFTSFIAAWAESYTLAIKAYEALPKTNPDCYIATAAAKGHRKVVGSWSSADTLINSQVAILKAGERSIARRCPRVHQTMRSVYDFLGPGIAHRMTNPFIADLAYLMLKPVEWMTAAVMSIAPRDNRPNR